MAESGGIKRVVASVLILAIFALTFLILKPIIMPIIFGLLFAYIFGPIYRFLNKIVKNQNIAAFIIIAGLILIVLIPTIYFVPAIVSQAFEISVMIQNLNLTEVVQIFIKGNIASTIAINLDNIIGQFFTTFLVQFKNLLLNLPSLAFQFAVFLFTFYFATRDAENLGTYIRSLSPFSKPTETRLLQEFRGITNAIVFGQVLIGITQGLALGAGLFFLGVPNALVLTFMASLLSIIPILGSWLIWLPTSIYLLVSGQTFAGVFLLLYGALFVSSIDNLLRPYLLSRRSTLPIALSLIGTIGGFLFFGIAGLVLGPLIIAYTLIIIEFYRQGKLKDLFNK
ncbi:AI-2E family transporter [archaeon]|jgi:predicted PurR-regulated permease PerM|nr:AI-2E family transporter [archaeon]MBT7128888.1 AI-2E family transporter [archaeon]